MPRKNTTLLTVAVLFAFLLVSLLPAGVEAEELKRYIVGLELGAQGGALEGDAAVEARRPAIAQAQEVLV